MFFDEKRERKAQLLKFLFWELNVIVEGKAWDKNEWSKARWEVGLQVEEFLPFLEKNRTSEDTNVYVLFRDVERDQGEFPFFTEA